MIILIDNYDSFTFNVYHYLSEIGARVKVIRNDQISTDEVYGSLGDTGLFLETTPYDPQSPYSSSKASSDHFVRAY